MEQQTSNNVQVKEPFGGAHSNREEAFKIVEKQILKSFEELKKLTIKELVEQRMNKYSDMGVFKD